MSGKAKHDREYEIGRALALRQLDMFGHDEACSYCESGVHLGPGLRKCPQCRRQLRDCNRHRDCDLADERAREAGKLLPYHCHDYYCDECMLARARAC